MNFKTKIALACGLSTSLVVVGSLTPTITYAVQNAKNEPKTDDYNYTDADIVDTKTNLLVNYDRYPKPKSADYHEDFNVLEKVAEIESSSKSNKDKVYALLSVGTTLNIALVDWPYVLNKLKNRELSIASQVADQKEFKQLNDLYNSLHKEYAVAEIVNKETTILNDQILANHDEESRPEIAKLRARNLLKYEIESAKKTHDQLEQVANFTLNKEASLNSYYYDGNSRDSFITIDQLKDEGKLTLGADITSYLPNLAVNKDEIKDTFNLIQNTSYALNDTEFTLYARIESFDYEKSEGNFDITIDYGMIETKYNALPNREDFMIWYSDYKDVPQNQQISIFGDEEESKNPLKYHMLPSNEIIDDWAREWFANPEHQISFIQDNDHGFDTVRKIVEQKGGLSHRFAMEEMSEFMILPNGVKIDNTSLPGVNLNMVISDMDATTNKIDYKLLLTFDFAPDVTTQSEEYKTVVAVSKKIVEDLFKTYNNIVDTVAVFKDWAYQRNIGWPFDVIVGQNLLQVTMDVIATLESVLAGIIIAGISKTVDIKAIYTYWIMIVALILVGVGAGLGAAIAVMTSIYNFSNIFKYKDKGYSRNNYWSNISDILAKMKDNHKDDINNFVDNMFSTVIENKGKMEKLRNNPNPTMAEIDEIVGIFGKYELPTSNDSKDWTLGQKAYAINNWMMDLMKSDTSKYDWMIHAKYGIDNPAHDIIKEVPCAIVANQEALASESMFKYIPGLIASETGAVATGLVAICVCTFIESFMKDGFGFFNSWLTYSLLNAIVIVGLGFASGTFTEIFKIFDYKNASNNLETLCEKHSSPKLIPRTALSIIIIGIYACLLPYSKPKATTLTDFVMCAFGALIFLQTATYVAMFSNFK